MVQMGVSYSEVAHRFGIAPRTLRHWSHQHRNGLLKPLPRGCPARRSPRELRNLVVWLLCITGPSIGLPALQGIFSCMPRSELADILCRFRRLWRRSRRRLLHRLKWHRPGAVWAADHVQPKRPIDGKYPYVLSVRDLASRYQLAWLPVPDVGADTTAAALGSLFWQHGPPLVLKSDNGSGFIAADTTGMLDQWGIMHLRNPAKTPQYNGACEATGGWAKRMTEDQAILAGRPGRWMSQDLERARVFRNCLTRPWGHKGPTPEEVWQGHQPVTDDERDEFTTTVNRYREDERQRRGATDEAVPGGAARASIDRVAIRRALVRHGYLTVKRRLETPPIKPPGAAIFA
jgi:transposase InsO family protein